ncbi:MAG: NAD(P)/FAD-dependent oxidoreductase [Firmicutes bacterium]|nr:NAD(P)/FAD-dependent oxidoreductase [Bacillota bacterium]
MMASYILSKSGVEVTLLEKKKKLGQKMLIAGKGRCNVTNDCDMQTFLDNMPGNGKFLYSAYKNFTSADTQAWGEENGVPLKVERGKRVFPESDRSADIVSCMERQLRKAGTKVEFLSEVTEVLCTGEKVIGVSVGSRMIFADAVLVATGGMSYPLTGSTGDGYEFARSCGHTVTPIIPSLVPLTVAEEYVERLEGLSLRNITVNIYRDNKVMESRFGEMVFTSDGLSGPVILTASRAVAQYFAVKGEPLRLTIDLKPALSEKQLDERLLRDFEEFSKKDFRHIAEGLLPRKLIPVFMELCGVDPYKKGHQMSKEDRKKILRLLKSFPFTVTECHKVEEGIVTAGGVNVKEIDPKTMMSKKKQGLFFAGEVMDVDGFTGGFNIQAALCSGRQAGKAMAEYCLKG